MSWTLDELNARTFNYEVQQSSSTLQCLLLERAELIIELNEVELIIELNELNSRWIECSNVQLNEVQLCEDQLWDVQQRRSTLRCSTLRCLLLERDELSTKLNSTMRWLLECSTEKFNREVQLCEVNTAVLADWMSWTLRWVDYQRIELIVEVELSVSWTAIACCSTMRVQRWMKNYESDSWDLAISPAAIDEIEFSHCAVW